MRYRIAGLCVEVDGAGAFAARRMQAYRTEEGGVVDIKISVRENKSIVPERTSCYPRQSRLEWLEQAAYRRLPMQERAILMMRWERDGGQVEIELADVQQLGGPSLELRKFNAVGEALSIVLPYHNRLVLHSSALCQNGWGVAFSAPPGTGKSTHSQLWQEQFPGCTVINDDSPILHIRQEQVDVCGSPWSGKTEINQNISAPLKAVVFLKQAGYNRLECLRPGQALPRMLSQTKASPLAGREEKRLELIEALLRMVPVYQLECRPDLQAAKLCRKGVMGDA